MRFMRTVLANMNTARMSMAIIVLADIAVLMTKTTAKGVLILGIGSIRISALLRLKDIWKGGRPWK